MTNEETTKIINRLKSIEGRVRGVAKMVEDDACCADIVNQTKTVRAALQKVGVSMLDHYLHTCVAAALRSDDPDERAQTLDRIMNVFEAKGKFD